MCGIAGFCNETLDRKDTITKMTNRMKHRGPDASGYWLDAQSGWTLGHRRLSILDLSENGSQPMISASRRFVICFNGEIYNVEDLRNKLIRNGYIHNFRGTSDTEVLLEAIETYGVEATITECKGMFAIALYDRAKKIFYLLRDRVGEKPVYYGYINNGKNKPYFAFASEPALFAEISDFNKKINRDALAQYMLYSYIPAPLSIYEGIYKLGPGQILTLRAPFEKPEIHSYWSMKDVAIKGEKEQFEGSETEAAEHLENLLKNAIRQQMVADVPLGAFLSGGIDSTLIVALMQNLSHDPIQTFTIGFDDPKYNEAEFARNISNHLGTNHTELILTENEMKKAIPQMAYFFSEPFGDASMIPTYFVSKLARNKVTVSLSGDAGDELFCGYDGYWKCESFWKKSSRIPYFFRNQAANIVDNLPLKKKSNFVKISGCLHSQNICQLRDTVFNRKSYFAEHIVIGGNVNRLTTIHSHLQNNFSAMGLQDMLKYHPDDILVKVDRAGMAVSLENRIPMLDKEVVEFSWSLPVQYKYENGISKKILRNILYNYVPKELIDRPKQGFSVPLERWLMTGATHKWANELIQTSELVRDLYFDKNAVEMVWKQFVHSQSDTKTLWNILMAEQWYRSIRSSVSAQ